MVVTLAVITYLIVGAGHAIGFGVRDHKERFVTLFVWPLFWIFVVCVLIGSGLNSMIDYAQGRLGR